jgi:type I restriction enzyme, S subunit
MKFKRYPKYKNSGVEWLGEIPEHWDVKRLKLLAKITRGNTPSKVEDKNYTAEGLP